jgi:hypothetical protein
MDYGIPSKLYQILPNLETVYALKEKRRRTKKDTIFIQNVQYELENYLYNDEVAKIIEDETIDLNDYNYVFNYDDY